MMEVYQIFDGSNDPITEIWASLTSAQEAYLEMVGEAEGNFIEGTWEPEGMGPRAWHLEGYELVILEVELRS